MLPLKLLLTLLFRAVGVTFNQPKSGAEDGGLVEYSQSG
jgi:hypothetical protein